MERLHTYTFIHGLNGSGKDFNGSVLASRLGSESISTGDVFRGALKKEGEYARFHKTLAPYEDHIAAGGLLPNEAILSVFWDLNEDQAKRGIRHFIYSGFPRTLYQLMIVDDRLEWMGLQHRLAQRHIFLDVREEVAMDRSNQRRQNAVARGEDPRPDDTHETTLKRFEAFKTYTLPMVEALREQGRLIVVDANGTKQEVSRSMLRNFGLV